MSSDTFSPAMEQAVKQHLARRSASRTADGMLPRPEKLTCSACWKRPADLTAPRALCTGCLADLEEQSAVRQGYWPD